MLTLSFTCPKSLKPSLFSLFPPPISNHFSRHFTLSATTTTTPTTITERGLQFQTGGSFFRHESFTGRDLGVLSAALHKRTHLELRVLDAMSGCGVRSLRYLAEAGADFVWANDGNEEYRGVLTANLGAVSRDSEGNRRWVVTNSDANRVMTECYLQRDFFDFIDVDSFGSDSTFLRSAFNTLKIGGLLYLTSTDGYSAGGHRPNNSLASYGAYVRPMPYANEIGLRMLIGGAVREASVLGYYITPLFSYYSYHGPVFRVMLRVDRGKLSDMRHYGFISYCNKCGNSQAYSWGELGKMICSCSNYTKPSLVVSGPLWTGPLHQGPYLTEMLNLAKEWGWIGDGVGLDLEKLVNQMIDESDPDLPFGYIKLDQIAHRAKVNSPPIRNLMSVLQKEGFAVSRSHIASNAIKTNCPMTTCIKLVQDLQNH
ncbi:uncharacterized protein LOC141611734 [Silene latifolia]|uniref:uncharacterized protein LOC141611734 n=1 Tax=Silene latifolia TaxID=37657 RepID=UPI003D77F23C